MINNIEIYNITLNLTSPVLLYEYIETDYKKNVKLIIRLTNTKAMINSNYDDLINGIGFEFENSYELILEYVNYNLWGIATGTVSSLKTGVIEIYEKEIFTPENPIFK